MPVIDGIDYDQYYGYADLNFEALGGTYMSPAHGNEFTSGFRLGVINGQWVLVDPLGNVFVYKGLFGINTSLHTQTLGGTVEGGQAGRKISTTRNAKFSGAGTTWPQATTTKLTRCHFNGAGPNTFEISLPYIYHPTATTMNIRRTDRADSFGLSEPIKDIARSMAFNPPGNPGLFYRPSGNASSVGWGDWLDPKYAQGMATVVPSLPIGPNMVCFTFDESDYVSRWLRHGHPNEREGALSAPTFADDVGIHAGIGILFSRLVVTDSFTPQNQAVTFTDTTNYSKKKLIDNVKAKYGTIAALNAAWQTGGYYTSFDSDGGWGVGTGLADEDGLRPRTWFGQHSPTAHATGADYHTQGSDNNVVDSTSWGGAWPTSSGAPSMTNEVKVDLDQIMVESVEAWLKPYHDGLKARDPGVLFAAVNNAGWPMRPALKDVYNQYTDVFVGGSQLNIRIAAGERTLEDAQAHMNYVYSQVPKPHIVNYYWPPDRIDSCLYYQGPNGWSKNREGGLLHKTYLVGTTFAFKTTAGDIFPHIGWQKWEYFDHPGEGLHWGICSLNDNLYDGGDYRTPGQPDPWAPDRIAATEDFVYEDYLGFGGTSPRQLVDNDLIVGANIAIKDVFVTNMGVVPQPPPATIRLDLTINLEDQVHETAYTGMRVRFQNSQDGGQTWVDVQSNVRALTTLQSAGGPSTTSDFCDRPAGEGGEYRAGAALTDGTIFGPELFSNTVTEGGEPPDTDPPDAPLNLRIVNAVFTP